MVFEVNLKMFAFQQNYSSIGAWEVPDNFGTDPDWYLNLFNEKAQ
jgi:hypothetical protein